MIKDKGENTMSDINIVSMIISYLVPTVLGGIIGILSTKIKKNKAQEDAKEKAFEEKQKALEEGVQALLRNELVRRYREYEAKGEISILDKENIEGMFMPYEKLGGNGTVKQLIMVELMKLPTKIIKE